MQWEWDRVVARLVTDICERIADIMEIPPEVVDNGQEPDEDEDMAPRPRRPDGASGKHRQFLPTPERRRLSGVPLPAPHDPTVFRVATLPLAAADGIRAAVALTFGTGPAELRRLADGLEAESAEVCELCGGAGRLRHGIRTKSPCPHAA